MGDLKAKFKAFGWDVLEIKEGNNVEAILSGMKEAKNRTGKGKPVCVLLHTEMGNGVDFMMHTHAWHGKAPNECSIRISFSHKTLKLWRLLIHF